MRSNPGGRVFLNAGKSRGERRQPLLQEGGELEFGRFRLDRRARTLVADGARVALGGRAFDLLLALIDANGALVRKDDLLARVWPDTSADENNLQVQVLALRKALGADRDLIRTVPKHGYRFMGRVVRSSDRHLAPPKSLSHPTATAPFGAATFLHLSSNWLGVRRICWS